MKKTRIRNPKGHGRKHSQRVTLRLTPAELERVDRQARLSRLTRSEYLRALIQLNPYIRE